MGNNKAWIGPNRVDLTSDTIYTHPSEIQCSASTEIDSLKSSVSSGKSLIAAAVTGMGVSTAATATFQTMANNIKKIDVITDGEKEIIDAITYTGRTTDSRHYRNAEIVSGSTLQALCSNSSTADKFILDTSYASAINYIAKFKRNGSTGYTFNVGQTATAVNATTVKLGLSVVSSTWYTMPKATIVEIDGNYVTFRLSNNSGRAYTDVTGVTVTWTTDLVIKTTFTVGMTYSYSNCPTGLSGSSLTVTW